MGYRSYIEIHMTCDCGVELVAVTWDRPHMNFPNDIVHCGCGKKYLVGRPFIIEVGEVLERAGN